MSHYEEMTKDIDRLNKSNRMNFVQWMIWGVTKITLLTARILDNVEEMNRKADDDDKDIFKLIAKAGLKYEDLI